MEYYEELEFPQALADKTECAHIFSESTNAGMEDEGKVSMPFHLSSLRFSHSILRGHMQRTPGQ